MKYYLHIFPLLLLCFLNFAQNGSVDSVTLILNSNKPDTNSAKLIYLLNVKKTSTGQYEEIVKQSRKILNFITQSEDPFWYAQNLRIIGVALERTGQMDSALVYYKNALVIAKTINKRKLEAQCYHNIGFANYLLSSFDNAITAYLNSIKIREELKDSVPLAWSLNNIGLIYWRQHSKNDALKHFIHARDIFKNKKFLEGLAISTSNIGLIYDEQGDKTIALQYFFESYRINITIKNKNGIALNLNNIGEIFRFQKQYDSCEYYLHKALTLNSEINNLEGLELNYRNLADLQRLKGKFAEALEFIHKAIKISKEGNLPQGMIAAYDNLSLIYADQKNYKEAYKAHLYYSKLNDSLNFGDKLASMEAAFGKEKMEKEVSLLKNAKEISDLQLKKKQWIIYTAVIGIVLLMIFFFFVIKINVQRKNTNRSLEQKNNEITKQKEIIEEKSNDITDSILYAKRIQSAVLPEKTEFKSLFSDSFVLFEPRDIVSGDFYWLDRVKDTIILILADCTGHGVPGAFMSIIGHDLLNQIIKEEKQIDPAAILSELDFKLHQILNKNTQSNNDGMDIAVCAFNLQTNTVLFCGAGRPLIVVTHNELQLHAGHKFSIGGSSHHIHKTFQNKQFEITSSQQYYLLSDGYSDQFGGEKGKKFKTKQLLATIQRISSLPMSEQINLLAETFKKWKGDLEQVDDVCVIGVQL